MNYESFQMIPWSSLEARMRAPFYEPPPHLVDLLGLPSIEGEGTEVEMCLQEVYFLHAELETIRFNEELNSVCAGIMDLVSPPVMLDINDEGDIVEVDTGKVVSEWVWSVDDIPVHD